MLLRKRNERKAKNNMDERQKTFKCELYNDHFENAKRYQIPRAQLIIADIPYNLGENMYASNPAWYKDGDNKNGESELAGKMAFETDKDFKINNFFDFCSRLLRKEPKAKGQAPAMIVFHAWQDRQVVLDEAKKHGFNKAYPLYFTKKSSPQVLKANMKIVGATEEAIVLYRDKLPKFNNGGAMILNHAPWEKDSSYPTIHPTQKPIPVLKRLIEIFTDEGDVVIDPVAGSGSTLRAAIEMNRNAYGFEIKKDFYRKAKEQMLSTFQPSLF